MKIDLLIKDARVFNSAYKKFNDANVAVLDGRILCVDKTKKIEFDTKKTIDASGRYLIPGLIDIHMHIESSMTTPEILTNEVKRFGITTLVAEPHEIANVAGMAGIKEFMASKNECPIDVFYGVPSSVPSTNPNLETTGAILNLEDMIEISKLEDIICVGEVMNYRGVIKDSSLEVVKFLEYVRKERKDLVVEGHCPKLKGLDLSKFLYLGINGDHTYHTLDEIIEQFEGGMFVELQEKTLKEDIINHVKENNLYENMCFITDDIMPDYFLNKGHLNYIVKMAMERGFPVEEAVYCATTTPAKRMRLFDRGSIAPGKIADMVLLDSVEKLEVVKTLKDGNVVYDREVEDTATVNNFKYSEELCNSIKLGEISSEDLIIKHSKDGMVTCRVMEVVDGKTFTKATTRDIEVIDGKLRWEDTDCLLVAVFERYGKNGGIGYGLVTGDIIKEGALATTYAHDCHNLLVVGKKVEDMVVAANKVISNQGGIVAVNEKEVLSNIKLNIGGILSEKPMSELGREIEEFKGVVAKLGYKHYNPVMSLCTLTLPVSPELKITDKGLIDVEKGIVVPLIVDNK